jgi:hypothetical protein
VVGLQLPPLREGREDIQDTPAATGTRFREPTQMACASSSTERTRRAGAEHGCLFGAAADTGSEGGHQAVAPQCHAP